MIVKIEKPIKYMGNYEWNRTRALNTMNAYVVLHRFELGFFLCVFFGEVVSYKSIR